MRKFSELGNVHRNEPCEEYPGAWLVYVNGNDESTFASQGDAIADAKAKSEANPEAKVSVCWSASDNDPRIGEVWFTGFYQLGYYAPPFGFWKE